MSTTVESLREVLTALRERQAKVEQIAAELPKVRREIREVEKTIHRLTGEATRPPTGITSARVLGVLQEANQPLTLRDIAEALGADDGRLCAGATTWLVRKGEAVKIGKNTYVVAGVRAA